MQENTEDGFIICRFERLSQIYIYEKGIWLAGVLL